jgi:hypothetical protein
MIRYTGFLALLAFALILPASVRTAARGRSLGVTPAQSEDKYEMPATFAPRPAGKALNLFDEDVLLATAWMELSTATEPDARLVFDDSEEIDLFMAFLGGDTGGDVQVRFKLRGDTVVGRTKDKFRDFVDDDDVVLTRWWTLGVLPRGRYYVSIKVRDGTRFGRGEMRLHFEVLDLD